jgi:hypothetical protein
MAGVPRVKPKQDREPRLDDPFPDILKSIRAELDYWSGALARGAAQADPNGGTGHRLALITCGNWKHERSQRRLSTTGGFARR